MINRIRNFITGTFKAFQTPNAGFILTLLGASAQSFHTYSIAYYLSSFEGYTKVIQALILSLFFGAGLVYFTLKASNAQSFKDKDKFMKIANYFAWFEGFINLYYWVNKLIIVPGIENADFYGLIPAIPFSIALPLILKSYAGEVKNNEQLSSKEIDSIKQEIEKKLIELKNISAGNENNLTVLEKDLVDVKKIISSISNDRFMLEIQEKVQNGLFYCKIRLL